MGPIGFCYFATIFFENYQYATVLTKTFTLPQFFYSLLNRLTQKEWKNTSRLAIGQIQWHTGEN
jgi:hypothetical protein